MNRLFLLTLVCVAARAQSGVSMPKWIAPYAGATAQTRTLPSLIESTYQAKASTAAVVSHYGKLFESAGLIFAPSFDGMGTVIRASAPECDLMIKVREQDGGSFVRVSCAEKTPEMVAVATPRPAPVSAARTLPRAPAARDPLERAEEAERNRIKEMQKYDEPVNARPRSSPTWPAWLLDPQGGRLPVRKTAADSLFLSTAFSVAGELADVHAYYAKVLDSHGCAIMGRGKTYMESECKLDPRSITQTIVRVELSPTPGGTQVHMRVSSIP